jgi:tetratricopeptide (TPR) repeat protein
MQILFLARLPIVQSIKLLAKPKLLGGILVIVGAVSLGFWGRSQWLTANAYRYPFQTQSQSDVSKTLRREVAFYQQRIQINPDDGLNKAALAGSYLKLAKATGDTRWFLLAQQTAQSSLNALPIHNNGAHLILARVAEAKHDFATATQIAQEVLRHSPDNEEATTILVSANLARGKVLEADRAIKSLATKIPTLGTYLQQALVSAAQGKDAMATAQFQQAIKDEEPGEAGSSARARTLFGQFWLERGQLNRADQLFQEALRILPQYPPALLGMAQLETRRGQYDEAQDRYAQVYTDKALANIYDHLAIAGLAEMFALKGDRVKADEAWQRAEKLLRQHPELQTFGHRRELAQILLMRGRSQDLPEALNLMEAEVKIRRDPKTLDALAWALSKSQRYAEAQTIIQEAIKTGVRDAKLYYRAGLIAAALGQKIEADRDRQQAQQLDPSLSEKMQNLLGLK